VLAAKFPSQANGTNPVVLRAAAGAKLTDSKYKQPIDATVAAFKKDPDVRDATSPLAAKDILAKDASTGHIAPTTLVPGVLVWSAAGGGRGQAPADCLRTSESGH
jgi:hypothetical protein